MIVIERKDTREPFHLKTICLYEEPYQDYLTSTFVTRECDKERHSRNIRSHVYVTEEESKNENVQSFAVVRSIPPTGHKDKKNGRSFETIEASITFGDEI